MLNNQVAILILIVLCSGPWAADDAEQNTLRWDRAYSVQSQAQVDRRARPATLHQSHERQRKAAIGGERVTVAIFIMYKTTKTWECLNKFVNTFNDSLSFDIFFLSGEKVWTI